MNRAHQPTGLDAPSPFLLVAWGVYIEALRRKDFYVLAIFMGFFVLGVVILRASGINNPGQATFMLNLGMTMAFLMASILTLLTSARQVPLEMENRTLHPMLAKPLSRDQFLLGKWAASSIVGIVTMVILFLLGWLPVPPGEAHDGFLLLQVLVARMLALSMLAALGLLGSLVFPKALNIVLLGITYFLGGVLANYLRARAFHTPFQPVANWVACYIPNFDLFDLTKRYTDGANFVPGWQYVGILAYGLLATALFLALACAVFRRRPL